MGKMWMLILIIALARPALAEDGVRKVDCGKGKTITKALQQAKPGDTIRVMGFCEETVTITTDRITLDGQESAILDGGGGGDSGGVTFAGVITIDGAQGVTITGFTVQHGFADGITGQRGAAFTVHNTIVQDNADDGIQVGENATADLTDCTVRGNGGRGIVAFGSSNVDFRGVNEISDNTTAGILIADNANAFFIEGAVQANSNGVDGLLIAHNSNASISNLAPTITTNGNGRDGIFLINSGSFRTGGTIDSAHNGRHGIDVVAGSALFMTGTTVSLHDNTQAGLNVGVSSEVLAAATATTPLTITDNLTAGVSVDDASVRISGATIQNNGPVDVILTFGARATLLGGTIGTISCDSTALIRGAMCP